MEEYVADRRTARLEGHRFYYTGKKCPSGHVAVRYTSNGACSECLNIQNKVYIENVKTGRKAAKICKCGEEYVDRGCTECKKKRSYSWRVKNRKYLSDRQKKRVDICRQYSRNLKQNTACTDCKNFYPWYIMEFDHVRDKSKNISALVASGTLTALIEEIKKCEIVCGNCHNSRTHFRAIENGERYEL